MTAIEVSKWWQKTGITLKSEYGLIYLIENCHHKWKVLFKQRLKITDAQKKSRTVFLANMEQPFWPVCPKYEKLMEKSADPRKKEDYEWLQRLKAGKPVSLGPPDRDYDQRINRRVQHQQVESGLPSTSQQSRARSSSHNREPLQNIDGNNLHL